MSSILFSNIDEIKKTKPHKGIELKYFFIILGIILATNLFIITNLNKCPDCNCPSIPRQELQEIPECPSCPDCNCYEDNYISDLEFVEAALQRYSKAHNYNDEFNCIDYSKNFELIMKDFGITAMSVQGFNAAEDSGHMWNCIEVSSQAGELSNNLDTYYNSVEINMLDEIQKNGLYMDNINS